MRRSAARNYGWSDFPCGPDCLSLPLWVIGGMKSSSILYMANNEERTVKTGTHMRSMHPHEPKSGLQGKIT